MSEAEAIVPRNLKRVTFYVHPDIYSKLEKWAEVEERPLSNLMARIAGQAVEQWEGDQSFLRDASEESQQNREAK